MAKSAKMKSKYFIEEIIVINIKAAENVIMKAKIFRRKSTGEIMAKAEKIEAKKKAIIEEAYIKEKKYRK